MDNDKYFKKTGGINHSNKKPEQKASVDNYEEMKRKADSAARDTDSGSGDAYKTPGSGKGGSYDDGYDADVSVNDDSSYDDGEKDEIDDFVGGFGTGFEDPGTFTPAPVKKKKSNTVLTVILVIIICLIAVCCVAFGVIYHNDKVQDENDQAAADKVIEEIENLSDPDSITTDSEESIEDARDDYDDLTADQKDKVTNESDLKKAESALQSAKEAEKKAEEEAKQQQIEQSNAQAEENERLAEENERLRKQQQSVVSNPSYSGSYRVTTSGSNLLLRTGPSKSYSIVARMPNGSYVQRYGSYNGWYYVNYNGLYGWANASYLR